MTDAEELIRRAFAAFNAADPDGFAAAMHPDIVFVPLLVPLSREPYRGPDGMRRYVRDAFRWAEPGSGVEVDDVRDFGDVVVFRGRIRVTASGRDASLSAVYVARIRDGLIADLITLADSGPARTALGIGDRPDAAGTLHLDLPAEPGSIGVVRQAARAYAEAAGCPDLDAVALAITEAATNVVIHAYYDQPERGPLLVEGHREPDAVVFSVQDCGRGLMPRLDSPGLGMGIGLMQHFAAEISFVGPPQRDRGTEVRLRFGSAA